MRARILLGIAGTTVVLLGAAPSALAATITVDSGADDGTACTLRDAVATANNDAPVTGCVTGSGNDMIAFAPAVTGTITLLGGSLQIDGIGSLDIQGPGASTLDVTTAGNGTVFEVGTGDTGSISGLTIRNGTETEGGGVFNAGTLTLDRVTVRNNSAIGVDMTPGTNTFAFTAGGGVHNTGDLTVDESTVSNNTATATASGGTSGNNAQAFGGGIYAAAGSSVTVTRSTINGNSASGAASGPGTNVEFVAGGGVSLDGTTDTDIELSTIVANSVSGVATPGSAVGAGIYGDAQTTLTSDTITDNTAIGAGANVFGGGTVAIQNTIFADAQGGGNNCLGVSSNGHNHADDATCDPDQVGDIANTEPDLLPLANYGGPTQTRPPDLPAMAVPTVIDKGVAASQATDQRGLQRTWNFDTANGVGGDGTDAGAVEVQGPVPLGTSPASPGNDDQPEIFGSSEGSGALVQLFGNATCAGPFITQGPQSTFASPGLTSTPVAPNSVTN